MSDVKFRIVQTTLPLVAGTHDVTLAGFGTPKAAMFFLGRGTSLGVNAPHAETSVGFTDGTSQGAVEGIALDGILTSDTNRRQSNAFVAVSSLSADITSIDFSIAFTSWITDGVRLTITGDPDAAYILTTVLIGGDDVAAAKVGTYAVDAVVDVTAVGFEPDLMFGVGTGTAGAVAGGIHYIQHFGAACNKAGNPQGGLAYSNVDAVSTTVVNSLVTSNTIAGQVFDDSITWQAVISDWDSQGFTSTGGTGSDVMFYLALQFTGDTQVSVFSMEDAVSTGLKQYRQPAFRPSFVIGAASPLGFYNTLSGAVTAGSFSYFMFDGTNTASLGIASSDSVSTTMEKSITADNITLLRADTGAVLTEASFSSFDQAGFTLNYSTVSGFAHKWWGVAIGDTAPSVPGSDGMGGDGVSFIEGVTLVDGVSIGDGVSG